MEKIDVIGCGYVGYSIALLLSKYNEVSVYDIDQNKINQIKNNELVIQDNSCKEFLESNILNLDGKLFDKSYSSNAAFVILCLPTNFNENTNSFDTKVLKDVIAQDREVNKSALIVIKSTIPIGFTDKMQKYFGNEIIFCPEFLREGKTIYDNLYPSRIIIGSSSKEAIKFSKIISEPSVNNPEVIFSTSKEAELIKLASNTYLAMRVSFFNEIDNYILSEDLNAETVIKGISKDPRIGESYNNPSFGYGGYCLPKDTKQLNSNLSFINSPILQSIDNSNAHRKDYLVRSILESDIKTIGIYKLAMKSGSDNFRSSAVLDIAKILHEKNIDVKIYEPSIVSGSILGIEVDNNFDHFVNSSDLILANRIDSNLKNIMNKVFTRDIFNSD